MNPSKKKEKKEKRNKEKNEEEKGQVFSDITKS